MGIEPTSSAWKAEAQPLDQTRFNKTRLLHVYLSAESLTAKLGRVAGVFEIWRRVGDSNS